VAEVKNNDSISKTLLVVLVLCLVCSIVVAGSAVGLKPLQQEQRALDKQRNILAVAGLMQEGMSADDVSAVFAERISARLVDLKTGELLDKDPAKYNQALALKDPQMSLRWRHRRIRPGLSAAAISRKFIWCATSKNAFRKWCCRSTATACGQ
jgi:Na+-transporting NADH:ubiquinone oxidoreductase subunit C